MKEKAKIVVDDTGVHITGGFVYYGTPGRREGAVWQVRNEGELVENKEE